MIHRFLHPRFPHNIIFLTIRLSLNPLPQTPTFTYTNQWTAAAMFFMFTTLTASRIPEKKKTFNGSYKFYNFSGL